MKTSFSKKFLACVLSVCMILTVCAGALSVSAAAAGTATIAQVEIASDAAEAIVPVTLTSDEAIGGAELYITVPAVANITKVDIATAGYDLTFASAETDLTATAGTPVTATVDVTTEGVAKFVLLGNGDFTGVATTVVINLTFAGAFAAGTTYDVDFAAGTMVGTAGTEAAVALTTTKGAIVVAAAHVCEYTYTNNGDNHTKACAGCGSSVVEDHTYTDGACVCGATEAPAGPVLDEDILIRDPDIDIQATLKIRLRVDKRTIPAGAASYEMVVIPTRYDLVTEGNLYNEYVEEEIPLVLDSETTNYATYYYNDAAMYELGLNVDAYVKCYDAEGNYIYYSAVKSYTPSVGLTALFNTTSTESTKRVVTDMLNMGAAAQEYIASLEQAKNSDAYNTVQAGELVNAGLSTQEFAGTLGTVDTTSNTIWNPNSAITSDTNKVSPTFALGVAPTPTILVYKASELKSNFSLEVSYTSLTGATTSYTITGDQWATVGTRLRHDVSSVAYYDGNAVITMKLSYDGVEACTTTYTVEAGLNSLFSNSNPKLVAFAQATAIFGATARARMIEFA